MKSKRWKRRNRHTRPEWVKAWRYAELCTWYYNDPHFPIWRDGQVIVSDGKGVYSTGYGLDSLLVQFFHAPEYD